MLQTCVQDSKVLYDETTLISSIIITILSTLSSQIIEQPYFASSIRYSQVLITNIVINTSSSSIEYGRIWMNLLSLYGCNLIKTLILFSQSQRIVVQSTHLLDCYAQENGIENARKFPSSVLGALPPPVFSL